MDDGVTRRDTPMGSCFLKWWSSYIYQRRTCDRRYRSEIRTELKIILAPLKVWMFDNTTGEDFKLPSHDMILNPICKSLNSSTKTPWSYASQLHAIIISESLKITSLSHTRKQTDIQHAKYLELSVTPKSKFTVRNRNPQSETTLKWCFLFYFIPVLSKSLLRQLASFISSLGP